MLTDLLQQLHETSIIDQFQHKKQFFLILEGALHFDHVGVSDHLQDVPLPHHALHLVVLYQVVLVQTLHSIDLPGILLLHAENLAKSPLA